MKFLKYLLAAVLVSIIIIGIAHTLVRPQQTRCVFIDYYDFEKEDNLYYRSEISDGRLDSLKSVVSEAEKRVDQFWNGFTANPKIIYCHTDEDYCKFGNPAMTPAVAILNIGAYIVVHPSGMNIDVLAHEMSHAELFNRIGFLNRERKIPVWFDEGLAMQVDWRPTFSIDSLKVLSDNFESLPNVKALNSYAEFGDGTNQQIHLNYATSKYLVGEWMDDQKLTAFIEMINKGQEFHSAYGE